VKRRGWKLRSRAGLYSSRAFWVNESSHSFSPFHFSLSLSFFLSLLVVSWILATLSLPQYLSFVNLHLATLRSFFFAHFRVLSIFAARFVLYSRKHFVYLCIGCGGILLITHITEFPFIFERTCERKINIRGCEALYASNERTFVRKSINPSLRANETCKHVPKESIKASENEIFFWHTHQKTIALDVPANNDFFIDICIVLTWVYVCGIKFYSLC